MKQKSLIFIVCLLLIASSLSLVVYAKTSVVVGKPDKNEISVGNVESDKTTKPQETVSLPTKPSTTTLDQLIEYNSKLNEKNEQKTTVPQQTETTELDIDNVRMNITFNPEVPDTVNGDIKLTIYNKASGKSYNIVLKESNGYFKTELLPIGAYVITKCTIPNNEDGRFIAEHETFLVGNRMNAECILNIIDTKPPVGSVEKDTTETEIISSTTQLITTESVETTEDVIVVEQEEKTNPFSSFAPVIIIILVLVLFVYKKYSKKDLDETTSKNSSNSDDNSLNRF